MQNKEDYEIVPFCKKALKKKKKKIHLHIKCKLIHLHNCADFTSKSHPCFKSVYKMKMKNTIIIVLLVIKNIYQLNK